MKSPMVTNLDCIPNKSGYSDLQVLSSAAGYYIGTMYLNVEENGTEWEEPGSRDSGYYRTREEAEDGRREGEAEAHEKEARMSTKGLDHVAIAVKDLDGDGDDGQDSAVTDGHSSAGNSVGPAAGSEHSVGASEAKGPAARSVVADGVGLASGDAVPKGLLAAPELASSRSSMPASVARTGRRAPGALRP